MLETFTHQKICDHVTHPLFRFHLVKSFCHDLGLLHIDKGCCSGRMRTIHIQLGVLHSGGEVNATLLLPPEGDGGRLLVEADAKAFQLVLYQLLVRDGLQAVQHNQDEVARPRSGDDLPTSAAMSPVDQLLGEGPQGCTLGCDIEDMVRGE